MPHARLCITLPPWGQRKVRLGLDQSEAKEERPKVTRKYTKGPLAKRLAHRIAFPLSAFSGPFAVRDACDVSTPQTLPSVYRIR